jgi:hypothetical protein
MKRFGIAFLIVLALALTSCAFWGAIIYRKPTVCEKLCDRYFYPGSLAYEVSATQCLCRYDDPMDDSLRQASNSSGISLMRLSRSGDARLTCTPDCATNAAKLK